MNVLENKIGLNNQYTIIGKKNIDNIINLPTEYFYSNGDNKIGVNIINKKWKNLPTLFSQSEISFYFKGNSKKEISRTKKHDSNKLVFELKLLMTATKQLEKDKFLRNKHDENEQSFNLSDISFLNLGGNESSICLTGDV